MFSLERNEKKKFFERTEIQNVSLSDFQFNSIHISFSIFSYRSDSRLRIIRFSF